ncbi:hypothetical protein FRB99_001869 [Tulasnella sp. 403]|nr:hypothetical protein FRB99_001869 [Tulasnella sp. 403]
MFESVLPSACQLTIILYCQDTLGLDTLLDDLHASLLRFEEDGDKNSLGRIDDLIEDASRKCPSSSPRHPDVLYALARVASIHFLLHGKLSDLNRAVANCRRALELLPATHGMRSRCLSDMGRLLANRAECVQDASDLERAIDLCIEATTMDNNCPNLVNSLIYVTLARYKFFQEPSDLGRAIKLGEQALSDPRQRDSSRAVCLNNLGFGLLLRFNREDFRSDLDRSISYYETSLALRPPHHPALQVTFGNVASALETRFMRDRNASDIDTAIHYFHRAVEMCPSGHIRRARCIQSLGNALAVRFKHKGNQVDFEDGMRLLKEALELGPSEGNQQIGILLSLSRILVMRFEKEATQADLDYAIIYLRQALALAPEGNKSRFDVLKDLGDAFHLRSVQVWGEESDLHDAITYFKEALATDPPSHPHRWSLAYSLSVSLHCRYQQRDDESDLNEAVAYAREAMQLVPVNNVYRPVILAHFGDEIISKLTFKPSSDCEDLDIAIASLQEARLFHQRGKAPELNAVQLLEALVAGLNMRYQTTKDVMDLNDLISCYQELMAHQPVGHRNRCESLHGLAMILLQAQRHPNSTVHQPDGAQTRIIELFREAANSKAGYNFSRLRASCDWLEAAEELEDESFQEACSSVLGLLDTIIGQGRQLTNRLGRLTAHEDLRRAIKMIVEAAAYAIESDETTFAVEILEQGRVLLFTQLQRYRTSLEDVRIVDPELADKFAQLSREVDEAVLFDDAIPVEDRTTLHDIANRFRTLRTEWEETIEQIRSIEGFEGFLRPTPFAVLQRAAICGPVIIVNVSVRRSDALIVCADGLPHPVPLPDATPDDVQFTLARLSKKSQSEVLIALEEIWEMIVRPIVQVLQNDLALPLKSRIWWCPTAAVSSLPLHAAGRYRKGGKNVHDMYISSYTPTLGALIRARSVAVKPAPVPSMLVVGQPNTPGQVELVAVREEVRQVKELLPHATLLEGEGGTRDMVLMSMAQHSWVHFACHGHQNHSRPFQSHFSLHDGPLYLLDVVERGLPHAELAVLSACHSAAGDRNAPDEFMHLAAGMQFAGFRSVVGTLWAMVDEDGPTLAHEFYKRMLGKLKTDGTPDYTKAATALSQTIKVLRRNQVPASRWINFVHFGA